MANELLGEFLGTMVLITLGSGVVASTLLKQSKGENSGWLSITTGWGIAVIVGIFVAQSAGSIQADINPAVTFAKFVLGDTYTPIQMAKVMSVEFAGAFFGAIVVFLAYLPHWKVTTDPEKKLAVYCTSPAIKHFPGNILNEIIGTFILILGVGAIFGQATSGHPVVGLGPYLIGILVWGIGLSLGGATGYAINPARDLGPRFAHWVLPIPGKSTSQWDYAWVPVLGPLVGGLFGAVFWKWVF